MYTVPSYVTYRTEEDAIYITSELYRNTVRLTDHGLQKEFINLIIMIVDRQRLCFVVTEIVFNNLAGAQSDLFSITVIRIPLIGKVIIHGDRII